MTKALRRVAAVLLAACFSAAGGCASTANEEPRRGGILTTGALQLGPNVGKDFLYLQGDGKFGL
jgi:hypothetical protein